MKYIDEAKTKTERITICLSKEDIDFIKKQKEKYKFRSISSFIRECVYKYGKKA